MNAVAIFQLGVGRWTLGVGRFFSLLLLALALLAAPPLLSQSPETTSGYGSGFLVPGQGYKDIYRASTDPVFGYPGPAPAKVDSFLYSGIFTVTLTY